MTTTFLEMISAPQSTQGEIDGLKNLLNLSQLASNEDAMSRLSDNMRAVSQKSQIAASKALLEGLYLQLSAAAKGGDLADTVQTVLSAIEFEHQKASFAGELVRVQELASSDAYPREFISKKLHELADSVAAGKYSFLPVTPTKAELLEHAERITRALNA